MSATIYFVMMHGRRAGKTSRKRLVDALQKLTGDIETIPEYRGRYAQMLRSVSDHKLRRWIRRHTPPKSGAVRPVVRWQPERRSEMKTRLVKLDHTGDTCVEFDETEATAKQRAEAERLFNEHVMKRLPAYQTLRPSGAPDAKLERLSDAEVGSEVVLVPVNEAG